MDYSLKRRLVGAAVLVALAVLIVPMLVDGPGPSQTPAERIPLDIPPAAQGPQQTRDIPLDLPTVSAPAAQTPAPAADSAVVAVDATPPAEDRPGAPAAPPAEAPPPEQATPPAGAAAKPPAPSTAVAPKPAPSDKPESVAAKPAPATRGRFVINLGSFADAANAQSLKSRLVAIGMPVIEESIDVDGKPARRLRAGPFATRAHAEAALVKIGGAVPGEKFAVLELDDAAPLAASQRPAVSSGFAVQLGALKDEREALALRDRVRGAGLPAYVEKAQTDAGVLWRVRAGPELDRARAESMRDRIKKALGLDGIVVSHP